jgi:hypothetical protein
MHINCEIRIVRKAFLGTIFSLVDFQRDFIMMMRHVEENISYFVQLFKAPLLHVLNHHNFLIID